MNPEHVKIGYTLMSLLATAIGVSLPPAPIVTKRPVQADDDIKDDIPLSERLLTQRSQHTKGKVGAYGQASTIDLVNVLRGQSKPIPPPAPQSPIGASTSEVGSTPAVLKTIKKRVTPKLRRKSAPKPWELAVLVYWCEVVGNHGNSNCTWSQLMDVIGINDRSVESWRSMYRNYFDKIVSSDDMRQSVMTALPPKLKKKMDDYCIEEAIKSPEILTQIDPVAQMLKDNPLFLSDDEEETAYIG